MVGHIDFSPILYWTKVNFTDTCFFFFFFLLRVCVKWLTYPLHRIIDGVELQRLGQE